MKKYILTIFSLLIAGCGIYLWANSISKKERLELLNGEYELVDWQIRPKSAIHADSLTVHDVPRMEHDFTGVVAPDVTENEKIGPKNRADGWKI